MFAITGITGQVGGALGEALLARGNKIRAVVRTEAKGQPWAQQGAEIALAEMDDSEALTKAFTGANAVFILLPPVFDPSGDFAEPRANIAAIKQALQVAHPQHVVCLSTVGAQATQPNLLNALGLMEKELKDVCESVVFLRAGWFMENYLWDVESAKETGIIYSHLQPLERAIPMVATVDIAALAAKLLTQPAPGTRIVELEGPQRYSPQLAAEAFSQVLGRAVTVKAVPRENWEADFLAQGMKNPRPRVQMLDGFNEGWIDFTGETVKGATPLETVLKQLLERHR
ncbi:NAD(P)H azoreductase [Cedecea lapagei]|uniref:NAD(P)H azoreductase n=1 Tax=Cedecea lapagei TaxID=158823 RepID=A0A447UZR1_9ENTR|nr:NmrA family NAD(P)-binding protein [Cedecea lapagei]VEB96170.1 NAD(P)H azoreductase [Cedecea lapagei]